MSEDSERAAADAWLGKVLGDRYRIESELGVGGLGMVFRALHLGLDRPVAVKVLHPELLPSASLRQRFDREVKTLSRLMHPHIVTLTDSGILEDGTGYLVMELLEGESLEDRLDGGALPPADAIAILRQVLLALVEAHEKGVLHRDIKPANVFLTPLADGGTHVKLLDFGLAKMRGDMGNSPGAYPTLTADGTVVGTPTYMAPEQAAAATADARSDVYACGIVLFEMLTGKPPFDGEGNLEIIRAHLAQPVPELEEVHPGLDPAPELRALVRRALEKDREDRFPSVRDMLSALDALPSPAARHVSGTAQTLPPPRPSTDAVTVSLRASELPMVTPPPASPGAPPPPPKAGAAAPRGRSLAPLAIVPLAAVAIGTAFLLWPDASTTTEPGAGGASSDAGLDMAATDGTGEGAGGEGSTAEGGEPEDSASDPANPFNASPLPDELRAARRRIHRGRALPPDQLRAVRAYQNANRTDARPTLLLARHHRLRGEWVASVRHYRAAHRVDPTAARFRPMLTDLVRAAQEPTSATAASRAIVDIFGPEALPAVERAASRRDLDDATRARLTALQDRLRAL